MGKVPQKLSEVFGDVISVYTQDQAIRDGILVFVGKLTSGARVVFTRNLFDSEEYNTPEMRLDIMRKGLELLAKPSSEDTSHMKRRVLDEGRVWVIMDGNGITFMHPEDY